MSARILLLFLLVSLTLAPACTTAQVPPPTGGVLYEGARLITGDGSEPIERSAFLVENGRFTSVGRQDEVQPPAGAVRVDLTGKTVMPAMIDAHSHIGYTKDLSFGPQNYTRGNILDQMHRFAYFGVAASHAMGSDFGELPFQIRDELREGSDLDAARFLTAGRGLAPLEAVSPGNMRHAAYAVTTVEGARAGVRELAQRQVGLIKMWLTPRTTIDRVPAILDDVILHEAYARARLVPVDATGLESAKALFRGGVWVDPRGGTADPLTPPLYGAILDEAHTRGMRVAAHATALESAKALLGAGIDVFTHMISDVDDELLAQFERRPNTAVLLALSGPRRVVSAPWIDPPHPLIRETVSPAQITRLQDRLAGQSPETVEQGRQAWERLARGVRSLVAAGVKIGVGTDGGGQDGDQFVGWTMHAELEAMVAAGMTPAQVLVAATRNSAEILGLDDLGMVAEGKSADFIVLDANPLDDITNTRQISKVFLRGYEVARDRLRAGWATD